MALRSAVSDASRRDSGFRSGWVFFFGYGRDRIATEAKVGWGGVYSMEFFSKEWVD